MLTKEALEQFLFLLFTGTVNINNLPENLYQAIAEHLFSGVQKGIGKSFEKTLVQSPDFNILKSFETNCYRFSAAKTFQQVYEIQKHIFDEDGYKRPFNKFREDAMGTYDQFNKNWLKTEYNTAIAQGQAAEQWQEIEKQKDILPYLTFRTVEDDRVREDHQALDGICLSVDDSFWDQNFPPLEFNCRCQAEQTSKGDETPDKDVKERLSNTTIDESFRFNAGKDSIAFSDAHPYFDVPEKYQAYKENNFNLPLPEAKVFISTEQSFAEAKTIKEAEQYAINQLGVKYANFKGLNVDIANDMNRGLFNTQAFIPEYRMNGIGVAQEANKAIKSDLLAAFKSNPGFADIKREYGEDLANKAASKFANGSVPKVSKGTLAYSAKINNIRLYGEAVDLSKYKGVYVNIENAKSKQMIDDIVIRNEKVGWFAKGAKDFSYIMNHELGHELDGMLQIRESKEFIEVFQRERKLGAVSMSEKLSKYAATAGGKANERVIKGEVIAESWAEYVSSPNPRPLSVEIGEIITKKYYSEYIQGTKNVTYKSWIAQIQKIIRQ